MKHSFIKKTAVAIMPAAALILALPAMAQTSLPDSGIHSYTDIVNLLEKAVQWMYQIFFILAVLFILVAAFTYLRAGGDPAQVKKAQTMLKNAVIAIVIALISTAAALIIQNFIKTP